MRPKEAKTNAMEGIVDARMSSSGGGVICGENVATKGSRDNNQHEEFCAILHWLENYKFVIHNGKSVLTDIVIVGRVKAIQISSGEIGLGS
jgi:hypothetical protein